MRVKGLERVAVTVDPEVKQRLMGLFDTHWWTGRVRQTENADLINLAIADVGLELIDGNSTILRSFHFRVVDLDEVGAELTRHHYPILAEFAVGRMRHLVACIEGLRIVFVAYEGSAHEALAART